MTHLHVNLYDIFFLLWSFFLFNFYFFIFTIPLKGIHNDLKDLFTINYFFS